MQKLTYIAWGVWAIACITLKILGLIGWWGATSCLWLPASQLLSSSLILYLTSDATYWVKRKQARKIPDSCATCLFGRAKKFLKDDKCIGEREGAEYGKICQHYRRHVGE